MGAASDDFHDAETGVKGKIQGHVAALLTDLIDRENDDGDKTSLSPRYVLDAIQDLPGEGVRLEGPERPVGLRMCLEKSPDSALHRRHFPGINPPRYVSEKAREPPDWDRAEIRSAWLHSLSR